MSTEIDPGIVREVAEAAFRSAVRAGSVSRDDHVEAALIASGAAGSVLSEKFDTYSRAACDEYDRLAAAAVLDDRALEGRGKNPAAQLRTFLIGNGGLLTPEQESDLREILNSLEPGANQDRQTSAVRVPAPPPDDRRCWNQHADERWHDCRLERGHNGDHSDGMCTWARSEYDKAGA